MRRFTITALFLLTLGACATPYGNYTKISDADNTAMVNDTVHKLVTLYPPASTQLQISQKITDSFGRDFLQKLRAQGYAVREGGTDFGDLVISALTPDSGPTPAPQNAHNASSNTKVESIQTAASNKENNNASGKVTSLSYIIDQIGGDMVRVTLNVDAQTLSRVYLMHGRHMNPAGSWTRKE